MNLPRPGTGVHGPAIHWPSVRGRARADRGPLALVAAVVLWRRGRRESAVWFVVS